MEMIEVTIRQNGQTKITELKNAIVNKVTSLISTHNSSNFAHSDIRTNINTVQIKPIEYIIGTQSASTNVWTGTSTKISTLSAGVCILYKLPYAGTTSNATLNLTLSDGTTKSGAKAIYFTDSTRVKQQYGANAIICLLYDGSYWRIINPYTNTTTNYYDRNRFSTIGVMIKTSFTDDYGLICGDKNGYVHLNSGVSFDLNYPILYYASTADMKADTYTTNGYSNYANVEIDYVKANITLSAHELIYLVGTVSNNVFTVDNTIVTQTPNVIGKVYLPIGLAITETNFIFFPIYNLMTYDGSKLVNYIQSHNHTKSEITDFPSAMPPTTHTHGFITNDGKIGNDSGKPIITTSNGMMTTGEFGITSGTFAEGNHTHSNYISIQNINSINDINNNGIYIYIDEEENT